MLVLSRNIGKGIHIGEDIYITLVDINPQGTQAKIGIDAPRDIPVHRDEIYVKLKNQESQKNDFPVLEDAENRGNR